MFRTALFTTSLLAIATTTAFANPRTIPIDQALSHTQKLEVSGVDHLLDFSDTGYRVLKAFPSNPQQLRALSLSRNDDQQLLLKWIPNGTAEKASVFVRVMGPSGEETITFLLSRTDKEPDNIRTAFVPSQAVTEDSAIPTTAKITPRPSVEIAANTLIRPDWKTQDPPKTTQKVPTSQPINRPTPSPIKLKSTPKPVQKVAKVSSRGRTLIDRSTLDNKALANYLLRGLHRARGRRQINRDHDNYWRTQSMARYLKRGVDIDKALQWSKLPEKTYNDLLGHGGVSR